MHLLQESDCGQPLLLRVIDNLLSTKQLKEPSISYPEQMKQDQFYTQVVYKTKGGSLAGTIPTLFSQAITHQMDDSIDQMIPIWLWNHSICMNDSNISPLNMNFVQ